MGGEMRQTPAYTQYHPKWYRSRISTYWWLGRWPYLRFILRELSSVFVAIWVVITLLQIRGLIQGPEAYAKLQGSMKSSLFITLNAVSFLFVLFHTVTWFRAAPQAMTVRVMGKRIPGALVVVANYALWLALSSAVAWFLLRE